jgi:hypothetical protein
MVKEKREVYRENQNEKDIIIISNRRRKKRSMIATD